MTAHQAKIGSVVYRRTGVLRGVIAARRKVCFSLHTELTVRWDDGTATTEHPTRLRKTPPGTDPNDVFRTRVKETQ